MASNLKELQQKYLGSVHFDGKEYRVLTITAYENGNQFIELLDTTNGEKVQMAYSKPVRF